MNIYLDNCCFNRPFDDQSFIRIKLETDAKLHIQGKVRTHELELTWSYILEFMSYSIKGKQLEMTRAFLKLSPEEIFAEAERRLDEIFAQAFINSLESIV